VECGVWSVECGVWNGMLNGGRLEKGTPMNSAKRTGKPMPSSFPRTHYLCAVALVLGIACRLSTAADPDIESPRQVEETDFTEMRDLTVALLDHRGEPIAGAQIMAYAIRVKEQTGHFFWPRDVIGPPATVLSGADGKVVIQYPIYLGVGPHVLTTRLVTFSVKHADFVQETTHFDLGPEQAKLTLKAGCEVQLSAVDTNGDPIHGFGVLVAGPSGSELWEDTASGGRRTGAINDGSWQTLLVKLQEQGPTLFSNVLPLRVRPAQTVRMRNIEMSLGVRVRGMISPDVPRPVSGHVVTTSVPRPAQDSWSAEDPSVTWHQWTEIDRDGTFELESLPRGGDLQVIAVCDGWISSTTVPDARSQVLGQIFPVDDNELSITIEMERTGSVAVTFRTENGQPFSEGRVYCSPNQRNWKGGSTTLGRRVRSDPFIQNQFLPYDRQLEVFDRELEVPFIRDVPGDGVVMLRGLPIGKNLRLSLAHKQFKLLDADPNGMRFKLDSPETLEMSATVVPVD
jgi:hypothetical protein